LEVSLLLAYLFAVGQVVFGGWFFIGARNYPLALAIPLVVAAAFRLGQRETATLIFMLAGVALWGTVHGSGPFVRATQNEALLLLQCFLGVTVVLAMPLAAVVSEHKRAEAKLESSESRFRQLAENIHEAFWVRDLQNQKVIYASPAYEDIWGLSRASLYADPQSLLNAVHLEDRAQVLESLERQSRGQHTVHEYRIVRPDGDIRWIRDRAYPLRNDAGEVRRVTGVAEDVTQKKETEQAMHEYQERIRQVIDTALDAVITIDSLGIITSWNAQAEKMFGWLRTEAVGNLLVDTIIPAQHKEAYLTGLQHYLAAGEGAALNRRIEMVARHRNGHEFPVELAIAAAKTAGVYTFSAFIRDLTEPKRAEKAVRENEAKFRAVFEKSLDAIGVSRQGIHVLVNPAYLKLFGFEQPEELVGRPVFELLASGERSRLREFVEGRSDGEAVPARYESRGLRQDGAEFDLDIDASAFELDGEPHTLVILRDITAQKRARAEIERLNAELEARVVRRTRQLEAANRDLEAFS
jgi:PAS domain S-box-containing protein